VSDPAGGSCHGRGLAPQAAPFLAPVPPPGLADPPRGPLVGKSVDTAECTSQVLLAVMASMPLVGQSVDAAEWAL